MRDAPPPFFCLPAFKKWKFGRLSEIMFGMYAMESIVEMIKGGFPHTSTQNFIKILLNIFKNNLY